MMLKNFLPSPALLEYVRFFGIVHFVFSKETNLPVKSYSPRPETSLCFLPRDPEYITYPGSSMKVKRPQALIHGQHTLLNTRYPGRDFLAFVVHFQPGVLYRLTGVPLQELTNTYVDAELVLSKEINFINERLNDCQSYREMILIVESYLMKLIEQLKKRTHGVDAAARYVLQQKEHVSIDWLTKETCLCSKQFERKFKERTGVTASTFSRIIRFDRTIKMKNTKPQMDWLSIALQCGYHDYQHLVRDYKEFTGFTPATYYNLEVKAPERIFGLFEEDNLYER